MGLEWCGCLVDDRDVEGDVVVGWGYVLFLVLDCGIEEGWLWLDLLYCLLYWDLLGY